MWIAATKPVARKAHVCQTCYRQIDAGTRYVRTFIASSDGVWTWKEHTECQVVGQTAHREMGLWQDEGYVHDDVYEYLSDFGHCYPDANHEIVAQRMGLAREEADVSNTASDHPVVEAG